MPWQHWIIAFFFIAQTLAHAPYVVKPEPNHKPVTPKHRIFIIVLLFVMLGLLLWGARA